MIILVEETHTITIITIQIITATVITIQSNTCYSNYLSKLLIIQTAKMVIMTKKHSKIQYNVVQYSKAHHGIVNTIQ